MDHETQRREVGMAERNWKTPSSASGVIAEPEPASPFDRLQLAVNRLLHASGCTSELAHRIAGPVPRPVSEAGDNAKVSGSLIDQMERSIAAINGLSVAIIEDCQRIQSRL